MRKRSPLLVMALSVLCTACEDISVVSLTLDTSIVEITEGETYTLSVTVSPHKAKNKMIIWSSSNKDIAEVDEGTIYGIKPGTATVTAKSDDSGVYATCDVLVKEPVFYVSEIKVTSSDLILREGEIYRLDVSVIPDNATNKNIIWSSSNPLIAIVDEGIIKALEEGKSTITAKSEDGGKTATCEVTVISNNFNTEKINENETVW